MHPDAITLRQLRALVAVDRFGSLTGAAVDDDDAMLEVLEPFAGQRGRVISLVNAAGISAPRHGPRYAPRDIRSQ